MPRITRPEVDAIIAREGASREAAIPLLNAVLARYGYLPDGPNTGDREYMSAFYRYTKFRPPYRKPAGDVLGPGATSKPWSIRRSTTSSTESAPSTS